MIYAMRHFAVAVFIVWLSTFAHSSAVAAEEFPLTAEQKNTQESLKRIMPGAVIVWNAKLKIPLSVKAIHSEPLKPEPHAIKSFFAENFGPLYQIKDPDREIIAGPLKTERDGTSSLSLFQRHNDVPVYGVALVLSFDREKRLQSVLGKWIPGITVDTKPRLTQAQASGRVASYLRKRYSGTATLPGKVELKPERTDLVIFNPIVYGKKKSINYLAYHVIVRDRVFFVDANTGEILYFYSNIQRARNRKTYTSDDCFSLPGTLAMSESGPVGGVTTDTEIQNAHTFAGKVYDYYSTTHGRDSYDNGGSSFVSTVHSGVPLDIISLLFCCLFGADCCGCIEENAAWIPSLNQVVYGDGGALSDGRSFNPFPNALDVVAHELTHGVIQYAITDSTGHPVGLDYTGESGALNESIADFFGAMVDRDDWLMGENLVAAGYPSGAMRNLADPTNGGAYDPANPEGSANAGNQPDHMDQFVPDGEVHINSGIHNKALYLIAEGGVHPRSHVTVKGLGRSVAEKILYNALTTKLHQTATFLEAREALQEAVQELYPGSTYKYVTVWNAYVACGICDSAVPDHCVPKEYPSTSSWLGVYKRLFARATHLALLRKYRDNYLLKSDPGGMFTSLFYKNSEEALEVLSNSEELMQQAKRLIETNKEAVKKVLQGKIGVINNTDEILSFLDRFAERSSGSLRNLLHRVEREMVNKRSENKTFLGFKLK